jgi:hypothetical protein
MCIILGKGLPLSLSQIIPAAAAGTSKPVVNGTSVGTPPKVLGGIAGSATTKGNLPTAATGAILNSLSTSTPLPTSS